MSNTCDLLLLCTSSFHTHPDKMDFNTETRAGIYQIELLAEVLWVVCLIFLSLAAAGSKYCELSCGCMQTCILSARVCVCLTHVIWEWFEAFVVILLHVFITRFPGCENSHQQIASLFSPVALAVWDSSVLLCLALACRKRNIIIRAKLEPIISN